MCLAFLAVQQLGNKFDFARVPFFYRIPVATVVQEGGRVKQRKNPFVIAQIFKIIITYKKIRNNYPLNSYPLPIINYYPLVVDESIGAVSVVVVVGLSSRHLKGPVPTRRQTINFSFSS